MYADRVYGLRISEIENHPLRVIRILLSGKRLREVRIALPITVWIAVRQARISHALNPVITGVAAMRKQVSIGMANGFTKIAAAREVPFAAWVTPGALGIPMPVFNIKFRILTIRHRLPAR